MNWLGKVFVVVIMTLFMGLAEEMVAMRRTTLATISVVFEKIYGCTKHKTGELQTEHNRRRGSRTR